MNKIFKMKNLAFTLAEMMVILTVFSVISAATLPVITARQNIDATDSVTNASTSRNPWVENANYRALGYYDSKSALGNTAAVMVGGQVSERAYSIGYPQLIVKDNFGVTAYGVGSQIVFLKQSSGVKYYAGRIALGVGGVNGSGSIAFGPGNMEYMGNNSHNVNASNYGNVAIGSGNLKKNIVSNSTTNQYYNTAIGKDILCYSGYDNVAIGQKLLNERLAALGLGEVYGNVVIGYGIQVPLMKSVVIGNYAGGSAYYDYPYNNVLIGTYSGYGNTGHGRVSIGHFSGYHKNMSSNANYSITIGTYAGTYSISGTVSFPHMIAIGSYAGTNTSHSGMDGIYIGRCAGTNSHTNKPATKKYQTIMIGTYAGYRNTVGGNSAHFSTASPIIIGSYAAFSKTNMTQTNGEMQEPVIIGPNAYRDQSSGVNYFPEVAIGNHAAAAAPSGHSGSIFIGTYAGYGMKTSKSAVCIGRYACAFGRGEYSTVVSPNGYYAGGLKGSTSVIGYPSAITTYESHLKAAYDGGSVSLYDRLTSTSGDANKFANMVLAPGGGVGGNRIFFYTSRIYGPKATFDVFSDKRLKENIVLSKYGLNEIRKINVYEFNYKNDNTKVPHIGVIAQEMQKIIPESVSKIGNSEYLAVSADWIVCPMINAIKELDKTVLGIDSGMKEYMTKYVSLADKVSKLEKEVKTLEKENKYLTKEVNKAYKKAKVAESRR